MIGGDVRRIIENSEFQVTRLQLGPYGNNSYILKDRASKEAVLVDAPWDAPRLLGELSDSHLVAILLTHAHPDHTMVLEDIRSSTGAPVGVNTLEPGAMELAPEMALEDGQVIPVGKIKLQVLHTPGHTLGSSTFVVHSLVAFCGDTIFPGGPGRTWSPEGFQALISSLEKKIFTLSPDTLLLPGHGEGITVRDSLSEYRRFVSKGPRRGLWGEVRWEGS